MLGASAVAQDDATAPGAASSSSGAAAPGATDDASGAAPADDADDGKGLGIMGRMGQAIGSAAKAVVGKATEVVENLTEIKAPPVELKRGIVRDEDNAEMDTHYTVLVPAKDDEEGKGIREVKAKNIVNVLAKVELEKTTHQNGKPFKEWVQIMDTTKKVNEKGEKIMQEKKDEEGKPALDKDGKTHVMEWADKDEDDATRIFRYQAGVKSVIPGWDRGTVGMQLKETRELIIPPRDGYGSCGYPEWEIPPGGKLRVTLTIEKIEDKPGRR